jgi:hypothetical protein
LAVADITKAALRNRVLEHLGVLAAGETPATVDQTYVEEIIDAAHEELRKVGTALFATGAIPSWAQIGLRNWVVAECGPTYGKPWSQAEVEQRKAQAELQLARQARSKKNGRPTKAYFY